MSAEGGSIGVGIVGAGFAASSHVDALRRLPRVRLAGIVGSSPERVRPAADRLGIERVYPDLDAMLADDGVAAVREEAAHLLHEREVPVVEADARGEGCDARGSSQPSCL